MPSGVNMTNIEPEFELIIDDLLEMAYTNAVSDRDTSALIGAIILLREYHEKLQR